MGNLVLRPLLQGETSLRNLTLNDSNIASMETVELNALRAENERLKKFEDNSDDILAGVIGRPTALPYDALMIDQGVSDGIKEGAPVYAAGNVGIGFITAVYEHSSLVALISTPDYVSTVYVYGPNIYTTAVGQGGGVTRIHVPQGLTLSVDDPVVMPSLARGIYGSIKAVDSVPERPEQYGYMTSDIPLSSIRFVTVGNEPLHVIDFETAREVVEQVRRDFLMVNVPPEELIDLGEAGTSTETSIEGNSSTATTTPQ